MTPCRCHSNRSSHITRMACLADTAKHQTTVISVLALMELPMLFIASSVRNLQCMQKDSEHFRLVALTRREATMQGSTRGSGNVLVM